MGFWNSLTLQGKVAIAAAILGGLFLLSLAYGGDRNSSGSGSGDNPGLSNTVVQGRTQLFATSTPTFNVEFPTSTPPPATPTVAAPTVAASATNPAPTAVRTPTRVPTPVEEELPPEEPPPPPPTLPPPTATSATGCRVSATIARSDTVTGTMTCGGTAVGAGAPMTATFTYENVSSGCSAIGNASGTATCTARLPAEPGALRSVDVCMTAQSGRVCTTVR